MKINNNEIEKVLKNNMPLVSNEEVEMIDEILTNMELVHTKKTETQKHITAVLIMDFYNKYYHCGKNKVEYTGRLTKDPIWIETKTGLPMVKLTIAHNLVQKRTFFNICFAFGDTAIEIYDNYKKGNKVNVICKLKENMFNYPEFIVNEISKEV